MKMIASIFTIWWKPMIGMLGALLIFGLGVLLERDWIITVFLYSLLALIVVIAISFVVQLFKMKWLGAIAQGLITVSIVYFIVIIFTYSPPDYFASHLTIPEGIEIETPIITGEPEVELDGEKFVLEAIVQAGIYQYLTEYVPRESGFVYAKAFELTNETRLSAERMKKKSSVLVEANELGVKSGEFTIYEGQWGQKYGARVEIWFEDENGIEELIGSKNYIVEGWQR